MTAATPLHERSGGLLLPISALPSPYGVGDLGPEAYRFIDFLAAGGLGWWQMLPIGPIGKGNSPYDSPSAFAGNPLFVSLDGLVKAGWLERSELRPAPRFPSGRADYEAALRFREPLLRLAWSRFRSRARGSGRASYQVFSRRERAWLEDFCLYTALVSSGSSGSWTTWDKGLRDRDSARMLRAAKEFADEMDYQKFLQFQFGAQWRALRRYAAGRGIRLMGDVAIFVSHDSADVWAHQDLFDLDSVGRPRVVAGVPPDYFTRDGQRWGNPHYRWDRHARTGYGWWIARLRKALEHFDAVRLDHFIGFYRFWEIPAGAPTARTGRYVSGPRADFFEAVRKRLGKLPFVAEDLGVVTPDVKALRDRFQLPGMKVLQFAFGTDLEALNYQPHRYPRRCVAYTGTHDNDTVMGWLNDRGSARSVRSAGAIARERANVLRYLGEGTGDLHWRLIRLLWSSVADTAIVPVQDVLGLGSIARMNRPGTIRGNWLWRLRPRQLTSAVARRLRELSFTYERLDPGQKQPKMKEITR